MQVLVASCVCLILGGGGILDLASFVADVGWQDPDSQVQDNQDEDNADERQADTADDASELLDRIFAQLDSTTFHNRNQAKSDLRRLIAKDDWRAVVSERMARSLSSPETSADVRGALQPLWNLHSDSYLATPRAISDKDAAAEIANLRSNRYSTRAAAEFRLRLACVEADNPAAFFGRLMEAAGAADDPHAARVLIELNQQMRIRWLKAEPGSWHFPPVAPGTIERHISTLTASTESQASQSNVDQAQEALVDLLLRADTSTAVREQLKAQLADKSHSPEVLLRLDQVYELTRHVVAIEGWVSREQTRVVERVEVTPNTAIDIWKNALGLDPTGVKTVITKVESGRVTISQCEYLAAGDYPLGECHMTADSSVPLFQIVELRTPREHLLYNLALAQQPFAARLQEVSQRTMHAWLERGGRLDQFQRFLLSIFDAGVMSNLAPQLLMLEDARAEKPEILAQAGSRPSHHQEICYILALYGQAEAVPGIMAAIDAKTILPPIKKDDPFAWPMVALFAIAERDPWPEAKTWLEAQLMSHEELHLGDKDDRGWKSPQPTARAAAAWILLKRSGADPEDERFGLKRLKFRSLDNVGCPSLAFASEEAYQRTLEWLKQSQTLRASQ